MTNALLSFVPVMVERKSKWGQMLYEEHINILHMMMMMMMMMLLFMEKLRYYGS